MRSIYKTVITTMAKRANKYIVAVIASLIFFGCVYDFDPSEYWDYNEAIVVEGDIIIGEYSYFRVSKTDSLSGDYGDIKYFENLRIWVEDENGNQIYGSLKYNADARGYFHAINTTSCSKDGKYRLCIEMMDGKKYASELMQVNIAPHIDSLSYSIPPDRSALIVEVTTHDSNSDSPIYCKWNFEEDWEFTNRIHADIKYNPYTFTIQELEPEERWVRRYCWNKSVINKTTVASSERIANNIIYREPVTTIAKDNKKISYLYSILVSQTAMTKDGYIYWETLNKNTNQTGGLFAPQPSELRGNVVCESNPQEQVLGYVNVTTVEKRRLFIECYNIGVYSPEDDCSQSSEPSEMWQAAYSAGKLPVMYDEEVSGNVLWADRKCVDCRYEGTKRKPSFWPNNHDEQY